MKRRLVFAAIAVVLLAGAGVTAALLIGGGGSQSVPSPAESRRLATSACREEANLERLVRANATATAVLKAADTSADDATRASLGDATWVQLASGLQLLRDSLRRDDASGTAQALSLIRSHCLPDVH